MAITIKSQNQILGELVRKLIADTPLDDVNDGSAIFTLLEGIAGSDFDNNVAALSVLELLNTDNLRNTNLDDKAESLGLKRKKAQKATGYISIVDSAITKRSSGLYPVKPAPYVGSTKLYVLDASTWSASGEVYIGRGSSTFEGPLTYTSITNNTTYYTINLSSALQKNHLLSEIVVDGQGTSNRLIPAGTAIQIPANSVSPTIEYITLRDAVIPAGDASVANIEAVAVLAGVTGNANIGTISTFGSLPFSTATVTNTSAFTGGSDIEADEDLKARIKAFASSLARGTDSAILNAIIGLFDATENKQIKSAVVVEPPTAADPAIIYLDDGSAFEPSFLGQAVDKLITSAVGDESFLQLNNSPLPRAQLVSAATEPIELSNGSFLRVTVDEEEETITFSDSDFSNIAAATLSEIVSAINTQATLFKARLTNSSSNLLIYTADDAETIQVSEIIDSDDVNLYANTALKFPTKQASYIKLYVNGELLQEREATASVTTNIFEVWSITTTQTLSIKVDSSPVQSVSFATSDFGGTAFADLSAQDWADLLPTKIAGISVEVLSTNQLKISSNKSGSDSQLYILGGSIVSPWFDGELVSSVGRDSDFTLNRHTGNIQLLRELDEGDIVSAGAEDVKGHIVSESFSGDVNLSSDTFSRPSNLVVVSDAQDFKIRSLPLTINSTITVSEQDSTTVRFMSNSLNTFINLVPGPNEYLYVTSHGNIGNVGNWVALSATGLFVIKAKGAHTAAGSDSYIEVQTNIPASDVISGTYTVSHEDDMVAFRSDTYPQVWTGASLTTPSASDIDEIILSINSHLSSIKASKYTNTSIKITSTTEEGGSIAIPVVTGRALDLFSPSTEVQTGYDSHVANVIESKDDIAWFKPGTAYDGDTSYPVWLDRTGYTEVTGPITLASENSLLTASTVLADANVEVNDIISTTMGPNKGHLANIAQLQSGDAVTIQSSKLAKQFDYTDSSTSEISLAKPLQLNASDRLVVKVDSDEDKNITTPLYRTGKVNGGSQSVVFSPVTTAFSADDVDGEVNTDFGSSIWGTALYPTNFSDYKILFRARNWYTTGGHGSGGGSFLVRATKYGLIGEKLRFSLVVPSEADQAAQVTEDDSAVTYTLISYNFASGAAIPVGVLSGASFTSTSLGSNMFRYTFGSGDFSGLAAGNYVTLLTVSGDNCGTFRISSVNSGTKSITVYNPDGVVTTPAIAGQASIECVADVAGSLTSTFFYLNTTLGQVAVWYDIDNVGNPEPAHGAPYSLEIDTVITDSSASDVAAYTTTALNNFQIGGNFIFDASVVTDTITVDNVDIDVCNLLSFVDSNTGFDFSGTTGVEAASDTILNASDISFYPITSPTVAQLVTAVNDATDRIQLVGQGNTALTISKATKDENYTYSSNATALAYGHQPDTDSDSYISLYDSQNWVLSNQTTNANFSLKKAMTLTGVSGAYSINLCPNYDSSSTGEFFKLIPSTQENLQHHLNHPALSQMSIVTDIDTTNNAKRTQIKSKQLGSSGSLEISSGIANNATLEVQGEAAVADLGTINYLELKVPTSDSLNVGDLVRLSNNEGASRKTRLADGLSTIDVEQVTDGVFRYVVNPKVEIRDYDDVTFTDTSATYGRSSGNIFQMAVAAYASYPFTQITGITDGICTTPTTFNATSSGSSGQFSIVDKSRGTATSPQIFRVVMASATVASLQSNWFRIYDHLGTPWAIWFSVNADLTEPTGAAYVAISAGNKVMVSLLSGDSVQQRQDKVTDAINNVLDASDIATIFSAETMDMAAFNAANVNTGDLLVISGLTTNTLGNGNSLAFTGSTALPGFPIVYKSGSSLGFINPKGATFTSQKAETLGLLSIISSPYIRFQLNHSVPAQIDTITVATNVATVVTTQPHGLVATDGFTIRGNASLGTPYTGTVSTAPNQYTFTFPLVVADTSYTTGNVIKTSSTPTRYRIEALGHNDLFRIRWTGTGNSPKFLDNGVALDDYVVISGSSFRSVNNGTFRVRGVSNSAIVIENPSGAEELNADDLWFNDFNTAVSWTNGSTSVTGVAGNFKNLAVGMSVKKASDPDSYYRVITALNASAASATAITLSDTYPGITGSEEGVYFQTTGTGVNFGKALQDQDDLIIYEGDSVLVGDTLFVSNQTDDGWFDSGNSGTFTIQEVGITEDFRPYIQVTNANGVEETGVDVGINADGFVIRESLANKLDSVRTVVNIIPDPVDATLNRLYLYPSDHAAKWSETNGTLVSAIGKLSFPSVPAVGLDGYLYYSGLLQKVQRTINGYDLDLDTYPGRKSLGASIELLPPLIKQVSLNINVSTNNGVVISDISSEVKSAIISYVLDLGVGENVILSEIIARVMKIRGVLAVTFTDPLPSEERIVIASNEKAFISASNINVG